MTIEMYKPLPGDCTRVAHPGMDGIETHKRYVAAVANRAEDGTLFLGVRHCCPLMTGSIDNWKKINRIEDKHNPKMEQGFVDQHGNFMNRREAMSVAVASCQIKKSIGYTSNELFSEHLY